MTKATLSALLGIGLALTCACAVAWQALPLVHAIAADLGGGR